MSSLSKGEEEEAFVGLYGRYWPRKEQAIAEAKSLASEYQSVTKQVESSAGNCLAGSYEFLGIRRLEKTYLTLVYAQRHQYAALPVAFLFYKGQQGWCLNKIEAGDSAAPDMVALAETEPPYPELRSLKQATDQCMRSLDQGRTDEAFSDLFKRDGGSKGDANANAETITRSLRYETSQLEADLGKLLVGRYEFLGSTRVGHIYATFVYIQKHEGGAVVVVFTFYNNAKGWILVKTTMADANKVEAALWIPEAKALSPEADSLKQATDRCMTSLSRGEIGEAITNLYLRYWPDKEEACAKAEAQTGKVRHLGSLYRFNIGGRLPGQYEFIGASRLGATFVTLFYVQRHELGISPVSFQFYKGAGNWVLNNATWGEEAKPDKRLWTLETETRSNELGALRQASDDCMKLLSNGEARAAFTDLFQDYWATRDEAAAKAEALCSEFERGTSQMGPSIGKPLAGQYELMDLSRLGASYCTMAYVLKREFGGFIVQLGFWKGQDRWYLRAASAGNDPQSAIDLYSFAEPAKQMGLVPTARK